MATRPGLLVTLVSPAGARGAARGLGPWLARVAPRRVHGAVTIALVTDARMRGLNRTFRRVDRATDVLSFPAFAQATARRFAPTPRSAPMCLGDIVIATGVATRQARAAGHALGTELRVLALHGLLHLLGYDHDTDNGRMARTEAKLRRAGALTEGLIERAGRGRRPATRSRQTTPATTAGRPRR